MCTARAVTQGSHNTYTRPRCTAACRPSCTILELTRHHAPQTSLPATAWCTSEVTLHPRTRTSDNHEPPFGAIAQFMDGGPWHRHDLTGRLSNQQPHLFPTRLVMPFSQSIVVMIGSVSILRLQVTLTRALMHSVIHTAFPCDCISSWKWIEMETDPI